MPDTDTHDRLRRLAATRWRIAILLTLAMVAIYFGFIALIAYDKTLMGSLVTPGLSLGILLGALVIVVSWVLTWVYVRWANAKYDVELAEIRAQRK
ncbi:MAG TPA: DUF485 domain-containing protein [Gemmatimonadaceae bacterium]|nr:DUF485 domain-containing protein [Gemmatimonadaceae bacterium]